MDIKIGRKDRGRRVYLWYFPCITITSVTLSIFPGFIAEDLASKLLHYWYAVLLIAIYNVLDFVGSLNYNLCCEGY